MQAYGEGNMCVWCVCGGEGDMGREWHGGGACVRLVCGGGGGDMASTRILHSLGTESSPQCPSLN